MKKKKLQSVGINENGQPDRGHSRRSDSTPSQTGYSLVTSASPAQTFITLDKYTAGAALKTKTQVTGLRNPSMETIECPSRLEYYRSNSLTNCRIPSIHFYSKSTETNRSVGLFINIKMLPYIFANQSPCLHRSYC